MKERAQKKPKFSLREVAVQAKKAGLSYGKYVAKENLK